MHFKSKPHNFVRKLPKVRPFMYGLTKKKCTECLNCEAVCPTEAIDLVALPESAKKNAFVKENGKTKSHQAHKHIYKFHLDFAKCIHCHACIDVCESKALFAYQGEAQPVLDKKNLKQNLMAGKKFLEQK